MALKDWHRVIDKSTTDWKQSWTNYHQFIFITISYDKKSFVVHNYPYEFEKFFNTKTQALKFVKSYMRTH